MTTLREAAQQALEALLDDPNKLVQISENHWESKRDLAVIAIRAALAEPVEPVAKVELMTTGGNAGLATRIVEIDDHLRDRLRPGQLLYTAPPQHKPVKTVNKTPAWWMDGLTATLMREGVNKHRAKEIAKGYWEAYCEVPMNEEQPK